MAANPRSRWRRPCLRAEVGWVLLPWTPPLWRTPEMNRRGADLTGCPREAGLGCRTLDADEGAIHEEKDLPANFPNDGLRQIDHGIERAELLTIHQIGAVMEAVLAERTARFRRSTLPSAMRRVTCQPLPASARPTSRIWPSADDSQRRQRPAALVAHRLGQPLAVPADHGSASATQDGRLAQDGPPRWSQDVLDSVGLDERPYLLECVPGLTSVCASLQRPRRYLLQCDRETWGPANG